MRTHAVWAGGYFAGLACEKWFVLGGWPDTRSAPAVVATVAAVAFALWVIVREERAS